MVWNSIDVVPPLIMLLRTFAQLNGSLDHLYDKPQLLNAYSVLISIASLMMWFKILNFLRIFESTGFLVRAIQDVMYQMRFFFMIFFIFVFAFGDAFKVMRMSNADDNGFYEGQGFVSSLFAVFCISLGEFDLDEFGTVAPTYGKILWILATIMLIVISLNLLIAVISEAFEKVSQQEERANYREKASLIAESMHILDKEQTDEWSQKNKFLLFVKNLKLTADEEFNSDLQLK